MKKNLHNLPLRNGVGIVVLNSTNKVFVGKRIDNPKKFWQMPQGGIDPGEEYFSAALRELKEETGIENVELIKEINETLTYELPSNLLGIIWKGKYRGQKQRWFIVRFKGNDSEINLKTHKPEFLDWKWIDIDEINKVAVNFKLEVYNKIQKHLKLLF